MIDMISSDSFTDKTENCLYEVDDNDNNQKKNRKFGSSI